MAGGEEPEGSERREKATSAFSRSAVPKFMLAERSTTTQVEQLAVGVRRPQLRLERPSGQVPVDPAGVVTGLVPPSAGIVAARARVAAQEFAAQQTVEAARDDELQPAQLRRLAGDRYNAFGRATGLRVTRRSS